MADPLSVTASVIAVVTLGLQSTKFVYDTISSLSKSSGVFGRTEKSLQSLNNVLLQIKELAHEPYRAEISPINHTTSLTHSHKDFFQSLQNAVQICVDELDPLAKKLSQWKATQDRKRWLKKVTDTLSVYIKSSDLREIDELVSKHLRILTMHLSIAGCKQNLQQSVVHAASTLDIKGQLARISTNVKESATEAKQYLSTHYAQALETSDQHTKALRAGFENLGKNNATLQDQSRVIIESLQQFMADQFSESRDYSRVLGSGIQELLCQLRSSEKFTRQNNLSVQLQDHIDRLYAISNAAKGDLNVDSEEAQLITEDLVTILQALLDEVGLPHPSEIIRKRRFGVIDEDDVAEAEAGIKQRRVFKRIRGLLESSQGVHIRSSNWQKDRVPKAPRLESQNRVFDTAVGSLAITSILVAPNRLSAKIIDGDEEITETFAGTLTLLPKTTGRNIKIRASFAQKVTISGSFSFLPTISFHAVIPDDSKVFQLIRAGDLDGLIRILQDGLASLTDCNTLGQSLLGYSLRSTAAFHPHICEFFIRKGADVDSLERGVYNDEMVPPLILAAYHAWTVGDDDDHFESILKCSKLLLEVGADPTLCNVCPTKNHGRPFLHVTVESMNMEILQMALHHGEFLLDLEQQDRNGRSPLLLAVSNACDPTFYSESDPSVETSFEQAELLLNHGASTLAKDIKGDTCLHLVFEVPGGSPRRIYRPHRLLTKLVARLIKAGSDVFALNKDGRSPSFVAWKNDYERSWREALAECGYSPQEVYEKSGVEFGELESFTVEDELVETLKNISVEYSGWTPKTMQEHLVHGIQSVADLSKPLCDYSHLSLSHLARHYKVDREWAEALRTCGYDPKLVYIESGINWTKPEDIIYDECAEEDMRSADDEVNEDNEFSDEEEFGIEEEMNAKTKTCGEEEEEEEEEKEKVLFQGIHAELSKNGNCYSAAEEGDHTLLSDIAQDIFIDSAMINMSEERAEDNLPASTRIEAVAKAVYDTEMGSRNAWNDFDSHHYHDHLRSSHENKHSATVWIQDCASTSKTGDLFEDGCESQANKNWSMDFGDETAAWTDTTDLAEGEPFYQGEVGRLPIDVEDQC